MVNKKVILGILTIGMLACVAGAGTFAYFSSAVDATGNTISTATISLVKSADIVATISDIVPAATADPVEIESLTLTPTNTAPADLISTISVTGAIPDGMTLTAKIGTEEKTLISGENKFTLESVTSKTDIPVKITYVFQDNGAANQAGQGASISVAGNFVLRQHVESVSAPEA